MERKTQELVDSRSRIESSRKRKQLYQLDGSDSSDSSTSKDAYKPRRRKIEKNRSGGEQKYCHQCKRNDGHVVTCNSCERKRYCTSCISKNYPEMNEEDFLVECPFCRDICNCKSCLRLELPEKNETRMSEADKKNYAKYLLRRLLPYVKQINEEQNLEKEMEAQIRGLPFSEVKVQQADCYVDERLNCNWCETSIADYHRSCTKCPYDLCISCCRDLRAGSLQAGHPGSMNQYKNPGVGYLHGETCKPARSNRSVGSSTATKDGGSRGKAKLPEWRPNKDGSISCPPESLGGCGGKGILRLNQVLRDGWLSNLILKAEELCQQYNLDGMPDPTHGCSCCNLAGDDTATEKIRKAIDIQAGDQKHFQAHWSKGEPVIVTGGLDRTYGLSWEPMVMSRAMHDKSNTGVTDLNCLNWCKEEYSLSLFFKGYTEGRLDLAGWPQMLKLNDWPESGSFEDHLPRHNVEFLSALPFKEYTHPQSGYLNLAVKLPEGHLKPDTGPKLYTAYGFSQQLGRGDSVSKLSYHDSDAVYVLTHVKEMTFSPSELAKMEQLKEKHRVQDEREIYAEGAMGNGPEPQLEFNDPEELQNPKSGALWDIYRREDAFKLKEYLRRHFKEFRHTYCLPLKQVVDPIYDGVFYLNDEHQRRLKGEYGIEPWRVVQNLGDAIFIPAGCPFQVRNLKVSTGFVSPESIHECLRFTEEIRVLPREHVAKEDKLGVKKLIIHAIKQVSNDLEEVTKTETAVTDSLDISSDSSVEGGYMGSDLANLEIESYYQEPNPTLVQGDFQEEANISQEVSDILTQRVKSVTSDNSPRQVPRSVPAAMVEFFNELEAQIQKENVDVLMVLPPQIHLDEEIIQEYEKSLKKHMSGRLLDLADDSNLQDFNRVLHFLLASRRIPSHLQQGFLALRRDLPNLTSRAYEHHKEVNRGMVMPLARSKEREELRSMVGKYRQVEENLVKFEKGKDTTMLSISRLQMRNEQLNEEVTNLRTAAENDVGDRSKLCNDEAWKLEEKINHNSAEIVRLQATNEAIGAKLVKFSDEAKRLHKDAHAQHYKVLNLEAMATAYERNVESTMDKLVIMEQNWKQRVQALDY